jgi:hypothetical protein
MKWLLTLAGILTVGFFAWAQSVQPNQTAKFRLVWDANQEPDVTHYEIFIHTNPFVAQASTNEAILAACQKFVVMGRTNTTVAQSNCSPGTYYMTIRAVNQWGMSSDFYSGTNGLGLVGEFIIPATPTGIFIQPIFP